MEVQTEELAMADKYNQAPDDVLTTYKQDDSVSFVSKKAKKEDDALKLEKFMARAGPVMELCVEENTKMRMLNDLSLEKPAAIELKQTLDFPEEILIMLGTHE